MTFEKKTFNVEGLDLGFFLFFLGLLRRLLRKKFHVFEALTLSKPSFVGSRLVEHALIEPPQNAVLPLLLLSLLLLLWLLLLFELYCH